MSKLELNPQTIELDWGGKKLTLETGHIARQADGAVLATYGSTQVLATVVAVKESNPEQDFFPLSVHYQEKFYATGRIPGGFFKREGRPTEKEILSSRLIDRPIRPLFPDNFRNETQILVTVLSHDLENDPDIVAMIAASAALKISGIPFLGPIAGARIGYQDGHFLLNPTITETKASNLDLVVAGTKDGVLMVESEAQELDEITMLKAVVYGHESLMPVIDAINQLAKKAGKTAWSIAEQPAYTNDLKKIIHTIKPQLVQAYQETKKQNRYELLASAKTNMEQVLINQLPDVMTTAGAKQQAYEIFDKLKAEIVRGNILKNKTRIDGRGLSDIRAIDGRVSLLNRTHGSALFTRGETQALVVTTLGTAQDNQIIDAIEGEYKETFLLQYNFPPYSVGEAGRVGSPGRREIGHGKLAWRAIRPLLPDKETFPYMLRVVSEITESNGSSSMATVCGTSMSLMDAGVPLRESCAGIAMGLIQDGDEFAVLSDILGDEDHLGDMDFKVAGTKNGITALQMDLKVTSITPAIMEIALTQAKTGRLHILDEMAKAISSSREDISTNAPRLTTIKIPKDKIREVIGTGGKVIREIVEVTGAKVDIDDEGTVTVAATDEAKGKAALDWIKGIVAEPEVNAIYRGKVASVVDFGVFVTFLGSKDGLVHVSEMAEHRVNHPSDMVAEGDMVYVKVLGSDNRGKVSLSMRSVDQATGEALDVAPRERRPRPERNEHRSDRGDHRSDRGGDRDRGGFGRRSGFDGGRGGKRRRDF